MEKIITTEILIVGAGPAGTIAAINLAHLRDVIILDRVEEPPNRIGESLPPAANKLLKDMGLFRLFIGDGHLPYYANHSRWSSDILQEVNFILDPNGHGWHLNRHRFEQRLRQLSVLRGGTLLAPVKILNVEYHNKYWHFKIQQQEQLYTIVAKFVIDAGGRRAPIAKLTGAIKTALDKLTCGWIVTNDYESSPGVSYVEAVPSGWWYSAPVPDKRRVLAFHTDSDLDESFISRNVKLLIKQAKHSRYIKKLFNDFDDCQIHRSGYTAAHSANLSVYTGNAWLAAGDAAMCFDPISSQGLFNSIYTGLAAAYAVDQYISGVTQALTEYSQTLANIFGKYQTNLKKFYGQQRRWLDSSAFWARRCSS